MASRVSTAGVLRAASSSSIAMACAGAMPHGSMDRRRRFTAASLVATRNARGFRPCRQVIECGPLSDLSVRHFQNPRAGIIISGSGPDLEAKLSCSCDCPSFPDPDLFDRCVYSRSSAPHTPLLSVRNDHVMKFMPQPPPPYPCRLDAVSSWPRSAGPFCWPVRSQSTSLACALEAAQSNHQLRMEFLSLLRSALSLRAGISIFSATSVPCLS